MKEREEWELFNNSEFGLLHEVSRPPAHPHPLAARPRPDDLDELLTLVWKKPAFFVAHPRAIAAFGREATRRGVPPVVIHLFGSPFLTWRGVPIVPSDKLPIDIDPVTGAQTTSILLLRVGEGEQGVVGLQKSGVTGEIETGPVGALHGHQRPFHRLAPRDPLLLGCGAGGRRHRTPR